MDKKFAPAFWLAAVVVAVIAGGGAYYFGYRAAQKTVLSLVDGGKIQSGAVRGTVLLGPTCPVERIPPDPACADKPYETTVQIIKVGSSQSQPFAAAKSDNRGRYEITLPAGEYALQPVGGAPLPHCETKSVTVEPNKTKEINLSCDTGIR